MSNGTCTAAYVQRLLYFASVQGGVEDFVTHQPIQKSALQLQSLMFDVTSPVNGIRSRKK